jgi:hypothetical protein
MGSNGSSVGLDGSHLDAQLRGVLQFPQASGGGQESFGGDAAAVDTGAAHFRTFDDGGFEAGFDGMQRRAMAADASTDDDQVKIKAHGETWITGASFSHLVGLPRNLAESIQTMR